MLQKRPIRSFLCFTIGSRSTHVILAFARLTAVKIAEWLRARRKKETARLEGYKASVAPFCGLFSLHEKIAQNGRLSPEAASGTAGRT